jgi:outer membrane lipoprotein-sorting protein
MSLLKTMINSAVLTLLLSVAAYGQDATEIIKKADEKMQGESSHAVVTMQIIRPAWERSMTLEMWSLGQDYSLMLVTAPARDEGTAYLQRDNEVWNWLPGVNRTIKLPPSMMSQSWMGSDFTNNDLVRESSIVTDYTHTLEGDSTISGYDTYKIVLTPKPDAPVVWSKVIAYISKEEYLQLRTEFYNEENELVRVIEGSDVQEMGGRIIPTRMEVIPQDEPDQKTVLIYEEIDFNIDISESFFSVQNMKRVG